MPISTEPLNVLDVLRSIPDSVLTIDQDRRLVALNEPARALIGAEEARAAGRRDCGSVLRTEICHTDRCPFDRAFLQGETVTTFNVRTEDGTPVCINTSPLRNEHGETVGVVETIRVVTHINRLIEELRDQRNKVQAVLDSIAEGVLTVDREGRITSFNRAAQRILGCGDCAIGEAAAARLPAEIAGPGAPLHETLSSGRPVGNREVTILDGAGRSFPISISAGPVRDEAGGTLGAVCTVRDLREIERLADERRQRGPLLGIVGKHPRMREVFDRVEMIRDSDSTVLIQGESGTGKGLLALALHRVSPRHARPFVKVSCAALPESLLESELFGHERGAFTGAIRDRKGRFELADRGTIFLDEIGDLSPAVQVKLLRVLQEQEFERVGGSETIRVDVRVIAATHRDLPRLMADGRFREDLYYRLNVIPVRIPALRERRSDIPLLVQHLLDHFASIGKGKAASISPRALAILMDHDWPGNVRELENVLEHAVVCSRGSVIEPEALPRALLVPAPSRPRAGRPRAQGTAPREERQRILRALEACSWNRGRAAARLGVDRTTLWRKMQRLQIAPR
ncbi:MAG TPA: sigma 54-interacting transcriptional regulator [Anaeromyxobacteraceae bacterium]|nr:sigma 54-interacting transcriptional regulator [Anaeromyxobacteraceae bacterium]